MVSRETDILRSWEGRLRDPVLLCTISNLLWIERNSLDTFVNKFNLPWGISWTYFKSMLFGCGCHWGWPWRKAISKGEMQAPTLGWRLLAQLWLTLGSLTWYRLARWWLVLIKNGWFTPGWSTSCAAAASRPSMMSRGVRKLASC